MLKNVKDVQVAERSTNVVAGLKDYLPANDNIAALSDHLLCAFEEPVNDNDELEDHRSLGVEIPTDRLAAGDLDAEALSYAQVVEGVAELDFTADRCGARGFLSE